MLVARLDGWAGGPVAGGRWSQTGAVGDAAAAQIGSGGAALAVPVPAINQINNVITKINQKNIDMQLT